MRRTIQVAALVVPVVVLAGVVRGIFQPVPAPTPPPVPGLPGWHSTAPEGEIYLVYQEQTIPDADLARVIDLIVNSVPSGNWASEPLRKNEGVDGLIDRVYDYFAKGDYRKPRTVAAIREAIVAANPGVEKARAGDLVRLPPIPVRGHGRYGYAAAVRAYEPERQAYVTRQQPMNVTMAAAPLVNDAAAMDPQRDATTTMVLLKLTEQLRTFVAKMGKAALPGTVAYLSAQASDTEPNKRIVNMARVEFLQPEPQALPPCEDVAKWFDESPYKSEALSRVRAVPRQTLIDRARAAPLTIIDTDFSGLGHGAKVMGVVKYALDSLGVHAAVQKAGVASFDLVGNSAPAKAKMRNVLDEYLQSDDAPADVPQAAATRKWIEDESPFAALPGYNVPDLLVQAVFWKYLRASGWINMSFRVDSPALRLVQRAFVEQRRSLALVAAGNDPGELLPGWLPQESAGIFPTLVNVSFGSRAGVVWGPRSGTVDKTVVSLLAPGCGYDSIGFKDRGTSFASPYVAAAAWVKHLVDQTAPLTMRRALLAAAQPVPGEATGIESGGFFDPARLLIEPRPHLILKAGRAVEHVVSPVVTVTCRTGAKVLQFPVTPRADALQSVIVYERDGSHYLWHRVVPLQPNAELEFERECAITAMEFRAGGTTKYTDAASFARDVLELLM